MKSRVLGHGVIEYVDPDAARKALLLSTEGPCAPHRPWVLSSSPYVFLTILLLK